MDITSKTSEALQFINIPQWVTISGIVKDRDLSEVLGAYIKNGGAIQPIIVSTTKESPHHPAYYVAFSMMDNKEDVQIIKELLV